MEKTHNKYSPYEMISYVFMACFILLGFVLHLMPMLIAGFVIFFMTNWVYTKIKPIVRGGRLAHSLTIILITFISVVILCAIVLGLYHAIHSKSLQLDDFQQNIYQLFQQFKTQMPQFIGNYIPDDMLEFKDSLINLAKNSSANIMQVTSNSAKLFAHIIIGLILGALVAFSLLSQDHESSDKPLIIALKARLSSFAKIFSLVIFAQFKIAMVNTILTAIYFFAILPLFGIEMPYGKTMVLLTFLLGLIPIIGNLVVNVIVVAISLTISFKVAIVSFIFLILVHKLEYYINAKVVGGNLKISIWELLIAMIVLESIFGIMGVVLGPVVYGYIKEELKHKQLV